MPIPNREGEGRMKITRIVATEDGESRFTEFDIPLPAKDLIGHTIHASDGFVSPNVSIVEFPRGGESGWHGASARQIVVVMSGVLEVEIGSGEKSQWRAGEIFIADDVAGKHITRSGDEPVCVMFIPFSPDFVIDEWQ
jgi:hypothetical protein